MRHIVGFLLLLSVLLSACGAGPRGNSFDGNYISDDEIRLEIAAENAERTAPASTSSTDPGDSTSCQRYQEDFDNRISRAFAPLTPLEQELHDSLQDYLAESGWTLPPPDPDDPTDPTALSLAGMSLSQAKDDDCNWSHSITLP